MLEGTFLGSRAQQWVCHRLSKLQTEVFLFSLLLGGVTLTTVKTGASFDRTQHVGFTNRPGDTTSQQPSFWSMFTCFQFVRHCELGSHVIPQMRMSVPMFWEPSALSLTKETAWL